MPAPFKVRVYETLLRLFNQTRYYTPTATIIDELGKDYFATYRALKSLEDDGLIIRKSRQSGWRPALLTSGVYNKLLEIYRWSHLPVPSQTIAMYFNYTSRHILSQLASLEKAGIVTRNSPRTGWQPNRTQPIPARDQIFDTLETIYQRQNQPIPARDIATALNVSDRYVRMVLSQSASVSRPSPRSGWIPIPA